MHRIYIDTETGTWGDSGSIQHLIQTDEQVKRIAEMSDTERIAYAENAFKDPPLYSTNQDGHDI